MKNCQELEPTPGGHSLVNKITQERINTVFDLIEEKWCQDCVERYNCKLLQILENEVCL